MQAAEPARHLFILHAYSQEYPWTRSQHTGFVQTLRARLDTPLEIASEHLDTKRLPLTDPYAAAFADYLRLKYRDFTPDLIYATDDNAVIFLAQQTIFPGVPVIFSGVNDTGMLHRLAGRPFTGVFETKEAAPNVEVIRRVSPQTRDVWFIGDGSGTHRAIEAAVRQAVKPYEMIRFHFVASRDLGAIRTALKGAPPRSFVILTTIGEFTGDDGTLLTPEVAISELTAMPHLVVMSMEDAYVTRGVIGGFVTSGTRQGELAAAMAVRVLGGEPVTAIHPTRRSPNTYLFDRRALIRARIMLPAPLRDQAVILNEPPGYVPRHRSTLLGAFFILFIGVMMLGTLLLFRLRDKNGQIERTRLAMEAMQGEHTQTQRRLEALQIEGRMGFWEWDPKTDRIIFSDGLLALLGVRSHECKGDLDALLGFVDPRARNALDDAVTALRTTGTPQTLHHALLCRDGTLLPTIHHLTADPSGIRGVLHAL